MIKRVIIPGFAAGIIMMLAGIGLSMAYNLVFPSLKSEYTDTYLFRSWDDPVMSLYFVHPILVALLLAWIWDKTKTVFPVSASSMKKALIFTSIYWLFSICGMIITYSSFQISLLMVSSWTLSAFIQGIIGSMVIVGLNPDR